MRKIKLSMMLLLMIFLTNCRTKIICSQIENSKFPPLLMYDISFKFERCRARCMDINTWTTLPLAKCGVKLDDTELMAIIADNSINYALEKCEGVAGFSIDDVALTVRPTIKKLDQLRKDSCN